MPCHKSLFQNIYRVARHYDTPTVCPIALYRVNGQVAYNLVLTSIYDIAHWPRQDWNPFNPKLS